MQKRVSSRFLGSIAALAAIPVAVLAVWPMTGTAAVVQPRLLSAGNYVVMGGQAITNTGPTVINGNLAISPNDQSSVTGFLPGVVNGTEDFNDANAISAQTDLITTYNDAAGATPFTDLTGQDLGGLTLVPGVYRFASSAQLTGTLTLDGQGSTDATFIFQIGSTLTTASASRVRLINGAGGCAVFWQVTSSATFGTATDFQGNVLALTSITMTTGATIGVGGGLDGGRALARNGSVTLDSNVITAPSPGCTFVPARSTTTSSTPKAKPTPTPSKPLIPGVPSTGGA
ncbi:MAG: ice-binding family protein [Candidatus Dormibacteraeota bacterium]|nr:ice-binding family protein [Candidatus Dormibacteraeota bacterium]